MTDHEINEACARKLGWYPVGIHWANQNNNYLIKNPSDYCHSIVAAWEIFSTVKTMGSIYRNPDCYWCSFATVPERTEAQADTAPMAICLAFLKLSA